MTDCEQCSEHTGLVEKVKSTHKLIDRNYEEIRANRRETRAVLKVFVGLLVSVTLIVIGVAIKGCG